MSAELLDLLVIGAGPAGLSVSAAAKEAGLKHVVLEAGTVTETITRFPEDMVFFSTPEKIEVGGVPFATGSPKPTKREALIYYRRVVKALGLPVRTYVRVVGLDGAAGDFTVRAEDLHGNPLELRARAVVAATGAHARPRTLGVPGEDGPHVFHDYDGPWRGFGRPVLVVGGRNSAVEAALDLWRHGAEVAISYRREAFTKSVKYWVLPDIENRIFEGSIKAYMPSEVVSIGRGTVRLRMAAPDDPDAVEKDVPADFVYLLTGYRMDTAFLETLGVAIAEDGVPVHDEESRETSVKGLYLAGRVCAGDESNRVFIENGREHGAAIVGALTNRGQAPRRHGLH